MENSEASITADQLNPAIGAVLNALRSYLKSLYGERLDSVILFGSQARGDARQDSDIDVLVVLRGRVDPSKEIQCTSKFVAQLCLEHNVVISRVFTTKEIYESKVSPFFLSVRREGITL